MKKIKIYCDRCGKEFSDQDYQVAELIYGTYPGRDICEACDSFLIITIACMTSDLIEELPPGTSLKKMAQNYGVDING